MINREILDYVENNDVKFVRLAFCDPFGNQKNISVLANLIEQIFENGMPFDAYAVPVFSDVTNSDLVLFPDTKTMTLLPWRPNINSVLRFYCDVKNPDKTDFECDGRFILKNAVRKLKKLGMDCEIGTECEFYLFKTDENDEPTYRTLDSGSYLDIAPLDKGENIRRDICLCLEEMGLEPEVSHHERGPGQNEIDFKVDDILSAADNFLTFKSVVKSMAERNGLFASFMPKPIPHVSGNGLHINISLFKDGENVFADHDADNFKYAKQFIAGIIAKISEITLFLNPNNNSYKRFGECEAPKYISWSHQNRSQLIRIPIANKGEERMELRSPDPTLNPYIAFALILHAGIYGIENELELQDPTEDNEIESMEMLPKNLKEAIANAQDSIFLKEILGENFLEKYIGIKNAEYFGYENSIDKDVYFKEKYFRNL